ncbi:MAG: helix-turn-helix transcriptional regulator [Flavobacteriales bacterium]|nr:helix-turn-helix transcriptional regulator [Flavobacteriales bacterium]
MTNLELGKRMSMIRHSRGRTQTEVALAINYNQPGISQIERGMCTASFEIIAQLALFLFFSLDVLMRMGPFDLLACLLPMPPAQPA